jgi:hypothetical protein
MRSTVLRARFLEAIVWVSGAQRRGTSPDNMLEIECSEAFIILSKSPPHDLSISWVDRLLRSNRPANLLELVDSVTAERMWPVVEGRLLEMHAGVMLEMIQKSGGRRTRVTILDDYFLNTDSWESAAVFYYLCVYYSRWTKK